jgi:hypothetical protein
MQELTILQTVLILSASALAVVLSIIVEALHRSLATRTATRDGGLSSKGWAEGLSIPSTSFPWFDTSRLTSVDLDYLSGLRTAMDSWKIRIDQDSPLCQTDYPIVLASITRGRFQAQLTSCLTSSTILLRDAANGTVVLIELVLHSGGESNEEVSSEISW